MSSWIQRVGALFGGHAAAPGVAAPRAARRSASPARAVAMMSAAPVAPLADLEPAGLTAPETADDPQQALFGWLLGTGASLDMPLLPHEHRRLARLDAVLADDDSHAELLPRAPAVIPQLMNSLRDERQSAHALADRVAKDPHLVAEVIRLANGAGVRAAEPVSDLPQAVLRLGTQGLRRAISKVVLKPIFDAPADSLSGRAAPRLWLHSEAAATECMRLAGAAGLDPFEGYLAGLMHNIGWTAALRILDRTPAVGGGAPLQFSSAFVLALKPRREMLFAKLVRPWQLTDALTALAAEILASGLRASPSTLAQALREADRHASLVMLAEGTSPTV